MIVNYALLEAVSDKPPGVDWKYIEAEFKKKLNVCRLSKFKSTAECQEFYSGFFLNRLNEDFPMTFQDWAIVYNDLLSEYTFSTNLTFFIALYRPGDYQYIFSGLRDCLMEELPKVRHCLNADNQQSVQGKNILRTYSSALASMRSIQRGFESVLITIKAQLNDQNIMAFCSVIETALSELVSYIEQQIQIVVAHAETPDAMEIHYRHPLVEDAIPALIEDLFSVYTDDVLTEAVILNENIINNAKEKANVAMVKLKKLEERIDQTVMQKWKNLREHQRNRKHAEMVGDASRIMHEIKRIMAAGATAALINPMVGIMIWVGTLAFDRATDLADRNVLVNDLKDELEIIEEKIQIADRKGDDKERIELIRIRQKLARELKRISHFKYKKRDG